MSRPKTGYFLAADGTYTVIDTHAVHPDGSPFTYRRDSLKTEFDVQKTISDLKIGQRRTRILLQHQHMGFQPIPIVAAQEHVLSCSKISTPIKMVLPSRYKQAIDVVGGSEYRLNYLENPDEKMELEQKIRSAFGSGTSKTRNSCLWLNQLITYTQRNRLLPLSVPKLFCGACARSNRLAACFGSNPNHLQVLNLFLDDHIGDLTDYEMHSFAVAVKTYLSIKHFSWTYVEIIRVSDWVRPFLSVSRLPQRCQFPLLLDAGNTADDIDTLAAGKDPDAYLFSTDPTGLKPIPYVKKMWFRKTLSRRMFGRRIDLSAFRQTQNSMAA